MTSKDEFLGQKHKTHSERNMEYREVSHSSSNLHNSNGNHTVRAESIQVSKAVAHENSFSSAQIKDVRHEEILKNFNKLLKENYDYILSVSDNHDYS